MDYLEKSEDKTLRLDVYETSNAPEQGFFRWVIGKYYPELKIWRPFARSRSYGCYDDMIAEGKAYLKHYVQNPELQPE